MKLDKCGVCGGDDSSCLESRFGWRREALSGCSASCGGGRVMVHYVCKDSHYNQRVKKGSVTSKESHKLCQWSVMRLIVLLGIEIKLCQSSGFKQFVIVG